MSSSNQDLHCDVVIVGSGAGGLALAWSLAAAGQKVVIVEKGRQWRPQDHQDLASESIERLYTKRGVQASLGCPTLMIPTGEAVGGTTVINSGTCYRTPDKILSRWQKEMGLEQLTREELRPHFEKIETLLDIEPADRAVMSRANTLVELGCAQLGIPSRPLDRNTTNCRGCGFCCYGCPSGAKQSADLSLLPLALEAGAQLVSGCEIQSFLRDGPRILGVQGRIRDDWTPSQISTSDLSGRKSQSRQITIRARETVLAMGSLATPVFLQKHKIGNRHVGQHLTLHPATKVFGIFDEDVHPWNGIPQGLGIEALQDEGILFEGVVLPPDLVAVSLPFVGNKLTEFMSHYPQTASFGFLIEDSSEGSVRHIPGLGPIIRYNMTDQDMVRVKKATVLLARIYFAAGAKRVISLLHGHAEFFNESELGRLEGAKLRPRDFDGMAFHPLGTCRMASTPDKGAIDEFNRVYGAVGLRVCDGSMVPTGLGVNPQVTIMALAMRLGQEMVHASPTIGMRQRQFTPQSFPIEGR